MAAQVDKPREFFHAVADIFSAKPIAALWDWAQAIGPPGEAWRPTAAYRGAKSTGRL